MQANLFEQETPSPRLPAGVKLACDVVTTASERIAIADIAALDLKPFAFHGFFGKRRTAAFGWRYDFNGAGLQKSAPMPAFLTQFREIAGAFAEIPPDAFEQALITEYAAGAGIGWHRDRPQFGVIVALSFAAPCRLRFRRQKQGGWDRADIIAPPRSVYLLSGEARQVWEHSIRPVEALRYSITFRTLRAGVA